MKKIRMGLESCEDVHDTTVRGDDYVDEPRASTNDEFDDLVTTNNAQPPSPTPVAQSVPKVKIFL